MLRTDDTWVVAVKGRFVVWASYGGLNFTAKLPEYDVRPAEAGPDRAAGAWAPVTPALPLAYAERAARELERRSGRARARGRSVPARGWLWGAAEEWEVRWRIRRDRSAVRRILETFPETGGALFLAAGPVQERPGRHPAFRDRRNQPGRHHDHGSREREPAEQAAEEALVFAVLEGRSLLSFEVKQALLEMGYTAPEPVDVLLHPWVRSGAVERIAAVGWDDLAGGTGGWRCRRCTSEEIALVPCLICGSERCPQCSACSSVGRSSACVALYHRPAGGSPIHLQDGQTLPQVDWGTHPQRDAQSGAVFVQLPFALSPGQTAISRALRVSRADVLVWAACGAGKTEVTYGAIEDVIREGGSVLFCVPRRDVVQQLGERLQGVFRGVDVVALHGGTPLKYARSRLTVATAHQALRFRECFDLLVVDEVDAFPLSREAWLRKALERALKPGGRRIYMSATPPEHLKWLARSGRIATYVLPERPHGRPLPVPEVMLWGGGKKHKVAEICSIARAIIRRGRTLLLFVPTVRLGFEMLVALGGQGLGRVDYVHGSDPGRTSKLKAAELGEIDVLISTTVLERGVTIPKVDVVVIDADCERVFDAATLIQMAGRSGRKLDDPEGRVVFLAERMTPAMRLAVHTVEELNRIAALQRAGGTAPPGGDGAPQVPCSGC